MKYERLTKREEYQGRAYTDECFGCESHCDTCPINEIVWERLAELEYKMEQGTLIELPCKIGDTVYFIYNRPHADKPMIEPKIYETKDWYFDIDGKGVAILPRSIRGYNGEYFYYLQKTVFLTREEAEKKLEELQNG